MSGVNARRSFYLFLIAFGALQLTTGEESVPALLTGFAKLLLGWRLIPDGRATTFYNIQSRREKQPEQFRQDVIALFELLRGERIHPAIAETVPLEQASEVHRRVDNAEITGKVVLRCSNSEA